MVGGRRNRIKISVNVPEAGDFLKETICPMCLFRNQEVKMRIDEVSKCYMCSECGYLAPHHLDPVIGSTLEAGNQENSMAPWMKEVKFSKKRTIETNKDTFNSAYEAWNSDQ